MTEEGAILFSVDLLRRGREGEQLLLQLFLLLSDCSSVRPLDRPAFSATVAGALSSVRPLSLSLPLPRVSQLLEWIPREPSIRSTDLGLHLRL